MRGRGEGPGAASVMPLCGVMAGPRRDRVSPLPWGPPSLAQGWGGISSQQLQFSHKLVRCHSLPYEGFDCSREQAFLCFLCDCCMGDVAVLLLLSPALGRITDTQQSWEGS